MNDLFSLPQETDPQGRGKADPNYDPFDYGDAAPVSRRDPAGPTCEFSALHSANAALKVSKGGKKENHHARAKTLLTKMHPGCQLYVCEKRVTVYSGRVVTVDQWGFLDLCGITAKGAWIGANVTTKAAMAKHMQDYTDPTNTHGQGQVKVIDLLEGYLARHGIFYIIGYEQVGRFWEATVWTVDQSLIDQYKARKRKR